MSLTISLTPDEVEQRLARMGLTCAFTPAERHAFETTPVVDRGVRVFGFPSPTENTGLTLRKIREAVGVDPRKPPSIADHDWYRTETFIDTACPPGWHFLTMEPLPGSILQPSAYAGSLGSSGLHLPLAVEVVLMLFLHYVGSGEQVMVKKHTWCADRASEDRQVTVGAFGRSGVFLSGHPSNFASQGLGICPRISES